MIHNDVHPRYAYRVDAQDRIVWVDDAWLEFAQENAGRELTADTVLNSSFWRFITDPDTREIYRLVMSRVRDSGHPIRIPFRCDSPTARRYMELEVSRQDSDTLEFQSHLVREEPRPYTPFLDAAVPRDGAWIRMCAWCKRVLIPDTGWVEIEEAMLKDPAFQALPAPRLTHGMCPACHAAKLAEIEARCEGARLIDPAVPRAERSV